MVAAEDSFITPLAPLILRGGIFEMRVVTRMQNSVASRGIY